MKPQKNQSYSVYFPLEKNYIRGSKWYGYKKSFKRWKYSYGLSMWRKGFLS